MLDMGVVLEGVHRQVLAVARLLVAAVRHLGGEGDVGVDPDTTESQGLRDPQRAAHVPFPYGRRKSVSGSVGPLYGLRLVVERLNGDDRTEDLVLDHLVVLLEPRDYRRVEEEPGQVGLRAAGDDLGPVRLPLEEALDALALPL